MDRMNTSVDKLAAFSASIALQSHNLAIVMSRLPIAPGAVKNHLQCALQVLQVTAAMNDTLLKIDECLGKYTQSMVEGTSR